MNTITTRTIHGIDLTAPGGLEALFAFNRSLYGDSIMLADGEGGNDGTNPDAAATNADGTPITATELDADGNPVVVPPVVPPVVDDAAAAQAAKEAADAEQAAKDKAAADAASENDDDDDDDEDDASTAKDVKSLPDWAQKLLEKQRNRTSKYRLGKQDAERVHQELVASLADSLGIDKAAFGPGTALDAIKGLRDSLTKVTVDSALDSAVAEYGADIAGTIKSLANADGRLKDLDTTDSEFKNKVKSVVLETVKAHPVLAAHAAGGGSGIDLGGSAPLDAMTKERFKTLNITEKSELLRKNPELYRQLSGTK